MKERRRMSTLTIAGAFIGTVVGAGFATGQEVFQFFTTFGVLGMIGLIIATSLFCYFGYLIMSFSRELKARSHLQLVRFAAGSRIGLLVDYFITVSFIGVLIVMAAGAGAIADEQFQLPAIYGILFILLLTFVTVISGLKNVIKAISFVVPFLLGAVLLVSIVSLIQSPLTLDKITFLSTQPSPAAPNWIAAALIYASYNMLLTVSILSPLGVVAESKRALFHGAILGGIGLGGGAIAINLAIASGAPDIITYEVPMVFLAARIGRFVAYAYGFILLLEIYTTTVSVLYGFVARLTEKRLYRIALAAAACVVAVITAQIGFSEMVTIVYPLMGYVGFVLLGSLLYVHLRKKMRA